MMTSGKGDEVFERVGKRAKYTVSDASSAIRAGEALGASVLIVDPPRKGLDDVVVEELCKPFNPKQAYVESTALLDIPDESVHWMNDLKTLIYVSCNFDSLARDCDRLLHGAAGWKLESATGFVLVPGSNHVETVCVFRR